MHAEAFIRYFKNHPLYPLDYIIKETWEKKPSKKSPSIIFFNSGRWIEQMLSIRKYYKSSSIVYRTGGNEIIKAPLTYSLDSHRKRQNIWVDILNRTVDLMITNSAFSEKRLRDLGLTIPFARCVGGVNLTPRNLKPIRNQKFRFFSAFRFVPYKNPHLLIDVFNELHRRGKDFSLFLAGDGPLFNQAHLAARKNPKIVFLGRCDNREILNQMVISDAYTQFSSDYETKVPGGSYIHTEGMGRSILEAISTGTYVIAGRCGALDEIVTSERGKLIPLGSIDKIVESLEMILQSPPKKLPPTDIFHWRYVFKQYENFYEDLDYHREI